MRINPSNYKDDIFGRVIIIHISEVMYYQIVKDSLNNIQAKEQDRRKIWQRCLVPVLLFVMAAALFFILRANAGDKARWPSQGYDVWQNGNLTADVSNISEGYFMARVTQATSKKMKLRVVSGGTTLDYDLPNTGEYIVVPLQLGSGSYSVLLYQNTSGKKYAQAGEIYFYAALNREDVAFLYPNQYVNYTILSEAVAEADRLCEGKSEQEAYETVCRYMKTNFVYDYVKAITIKAGKLPDIDGSFEKKMGVCQDLSAIMCCLLRTQGITARLIIGYADSSYHAWVVSTINGEREFFDPTAELNAIKAKEYSVERYY